MQPPPAPEPEFKPVLIKTEAIKKTSVSAPIIYEGFELLSDGALKKSHARPTVPQRQVPGVETIPSPVTSSIHTPQEAVGKQIEGKASWYCSAEKPICHYQYPVGSMVAAACGRLRAALGPGWRGTTVVVERIDGQRAPITVVLVDYCASTDKTIDLYGEPMSRLGGTGVLQVVVSW